MEQIIGYLFATITSLFFSMYVIPKKVIKEKTLYYTAFLTLGFLLTASTFCLFFTTQNFHNEPLSILLITLLLLRGFLWFLSVSIYAIAIEKIGISRATQYQNLKSPFGILLNLLFLQEFLITNLSTLLFSTTLTFISALLLSIPNTSNKKIDKLGIFYAIFSALLLATTNFLQKFITNQGIVYFQPILTAISSFLFACLAILLKDKNFKSAISIPKKHKLLALFGGTIFYFATFFQTLAYQKLPASIVTIIVQLSAIWSILIGIIIFKEIQWKQHWKRICLGIIMTILAILILL